MKILMASSEMTPLARTGGLGDVLEAFPAELARRGHEVSVVLPLYRAVRESHTGKMKPTGVTVAVQVGSKRIEADILEMTAPNGVQVFLVRRDEYFDRTGLYGADGRDYADNAERFIFFQKAVVELARRMTPAPDVIHVHDWQTAMIPTFVTERDLPFKTVLTIHNLAYQGGFWAVDFGLTALPPEYYGPLGVEFNGGLNFLKAGILYADIVTTVSERYAREIQTAEYGCGLHDVLRENSSKLRGVINGVDYEKWNPAADSQIAAPFTAKALAGKAACREKLLDGLKLEKNPTGPVYGMVTRLAEQKGLDILLPLLDRLLSDDVRLAILGDGDTRYERELQIAARRHEGRFAFVRGWDDALSHRLVAGADATLIPSHFEPCGLAAMYALRYGTLPVARAVGGLHQMIRDYDPSTDDGTGFLFYDYSAAALWDALGRTRDAFANRPLWEKMMRQAMALDFSWPSAAAAYERLYDHLVRA